MTEPAMSDSSGAEIVQFRPRNTLNSKIEYAKALAESGLLPAVYRGKPANVLWAQEYAESLRLSTMAIVNGIFVIEGKPTASAALISGLVRTAGHRLRVTGNDQKAVAEIVRKDDPGFTFRSEWTIERAKQAGLLGKNTWKQYPAAMLKARAVTEAARDACEEALNGCHYSPEELGAEVNEEGVPTMVVEQVRPEASAETDWDAEIAKCGNDRAKLLALYNRAPAGPIQEKVKAAGLRAKEAAAKPAEPIIVDAEIVEESMPAANRRPSKLEKGRTASELFDQLLACSSFDEAELVATTAPRVDVTGFLTADIREVLNIDGGVAYKLPEFAQLVADYVNRRKVSVNTAIGGEAA